jgi:transcriptional regulator with XRE-family HTH domain
MKTTANQRLKQFREKAGLRQEAIAAELDLSLSLLQKVESGQKDVSDKMAVMLNDRFQLPINWLLKGEGELTYSLIKENPYRDALYKELKDQVEFLKDTIKSITGSKSFLPALNQTAHKRGSRAAA